MYEQKEFINEEKKKTKKILVISILIILSFFIGLFVGASNSEKLNTQTNGSSVILNKDSKNLSKVDFKLFWEVWDLIKQKYVDPNIKDEDLYYGAQMGLVASLGDPYSVFLKPDISKDFNDELEGKFQGIGAEIGMKNNEIVVIAPLPNSPAEKAGIRPGDKIIAIDGIDASTISLNDAVLKIRGDKGTKVKLIILHKGEKTNKEIEITRDNIKYDSVKWEVKNNHIGYIKMTHFNQDTDELFNKAVIDLNNKKVDSIILDLRSNPGGYLSTAIKVASAWIDEGIIVKEVSRDKEKTQNYSANGMALFKGKKTIVLINNGSASASEIVAGALQDYGSAKIVGEKSFGKGSVQDLTELSDGSSLKLTIAKWFTPHDRSIDKEGIAPDIEIQITEDEYNKDQDPQLDKALELLK